MIICGFGGFLAMHGLGLVRVRVRVSSISQNRTIDAMKPRSEGIQHVFSVIGILK